MVSQNKYSSSTIKIYMLIYLSLVYLKLKKIKNYNFLYPFYLQRWSPYWLIKMYIEICNFLFSPALNTKYTNDKYILYIMEKEFWITTKKFDKNKISKMLVLSVIQSAPLKPILQWALCFLFSFFIFCFSFATILSTIVFLAM